VSESTRVRVVLLCCVVCEFVVAVLYRCTMLRVQNLVSQYDLDENLLFAGASETSWLLANKGHDLLSAFDDSSLLLSSAVASVSTSSASSSSPATSIRATQPDLFFSEFLSGALDVPVDVVNFEYVEPPPRSLANHHSHATTRARLIPAGILLIVHHSV